MPDNIGLAGSRGRWRHLAPADSGLAHGSLLAPCLFRQYRVVVKAAAGGRISFALAEVHKACALWASSQMNRTVVWRPLVG